PEEMKIHLIEGMGRVLPPMSETVSRKAHQFLRDLGVEIHLNTMVRTYDGKRVTTNREELYFDTSTFIWAAGVSGAPIEGLDASALAERAARYEVNEFNQVKGYENIFAIGDI